jgi:hypothetical protein
LGCIAIDLCGPDRSFARRRVLYWRKAARRSVDVALGLVGVKRSAGRRGKRSGLPVLIHLSD